MNKEILEVEAIEILANVIRRDSSTEYRIAAAKALLEHLRNKKETQHEREQ